MKNKLSFIFKLFILIMSGIGLYLNFNFMTVKDSIIYFTIQSNLFCFIFYFVILILALTKKLKKNDLYYIIKGMMTMAITITMVVYWALLSSTDGMGAYAGHMLECNFVHLYVPLLVIFDYIIFGEKGNLKKNYPFIWSLSLIVYTVFTVIYILLGGTYANGSKYPYFYMDVDTYGFMKVAINSLMIYIFFVGYGYIIQTLDNKLGSKKKLGAS